jgi:dynein heavy chain 1
MKTKLQQFQKMNKLIMELKTDAMKDRHWRSLFSKLKIVESVSEVTLGTLWDKDLMRYEVIVRDIMTIARGELVLEEMIRAVKDYWNSFELELVKYQTKCKLIRGWDELFTKLEEDLNNLASMKISPYYK